MYAYAVGMSGSMFQFAGIVICVVLFIAAVIGAFVFIPNLIGRVALLVSPYTTNQHLEFSCTNFMLWIRIRS